MTPEQIQVAIASTPLAWIDFNSFVNENQQPIEFHNHRFMIDFYADESDDIVSKKSAQVGFSVAAILKSGHECGFNKQNVIYVLPTKNVIGDFVKPKVNPLITSNPAFASIVKDDSVGLKRIGDRSLFFKGGFSDREAISITGDILVIDEYDRMPSMSVVNTFDSRLQASAHPKRWRFSNPSQVGFGVDALYTDSNQLHWMVTCDTCGYVSYMDWLKESYEWDGQTYQTHYVDRDRQVYACGDCDAEITDEARRMGEWVAKYPDRKRHGYWFSQMMAPWVTARRVIEQYEESNIEFFYNFVLGKAYTPTDMIVDRAAILRATAPSNIPRLQVAIGVDQDAGGQYYVCMTSQGIFDHGYVDAWEKIEQLKLMYNAIVVCDPNPYQAMPKQMAGKYNDWYLCYFKNLDGLSAVQWKEQEQVVYADRTRVIDIRANEIVNARLLYREHVHKLEDVIAHWNNLYRTTEEKEDGRIKSVWIKKDDKQSDYPFAECLIAGTMITTSNGDKPIETITTDDYVLTRKGYKRVKAAGLSGIKPVYRAEFTNGSVLVGTANHPIYTKNRGFIPLSEMYADDILEVCKSKKNMLSSMAVSIQDFLIQKSERIESTIVPLQNLKRYFIGIYGSLVTARFQRVMKSIMLTSTHSTMILGTSSVSVNQSTWHYMEKSGSRIQSIVRELLDKCIPQRQLLNQLLGNTVSKVSNSLITQNNGNIYENSIRLPAVDAARNIRHPITERIRVVQRLAPIGFICKKIAKSIWSLGHVLFAEKILKPINGKRLRHVQKNVAVSKLVKLNGVKAVYNLTVSEQPEYYANGILVHNCYARIGLSQLMGGGSEFLEPTSPSETKVTNITTTDGATLTVDFSGILQDTMAEFDE